MRRCTSADSRRSTNSVSFPPRRLQHWKKRTTIAKEVRDTNMSTLAMLPDIGQKIHTVYKCKKIIIERRVFTILAQSHRQRASASSVEKKSPASGVNEVFFIL